MLDKNDLSFFINNLALLINHEIKKVLFYFFKNKFCVFRVIELL